MADGTAGKVNRFLLVPVWTVAWLKMAYSKSSVQYLPLLLVGWMLEAPKANNTANSGRTK